ncbi:MAG: ATP-binding cassette domain-containing protein [Bacteroidota bacterium]
MITVEHLFKTFHLSKKQRKEAATKQAQIHAVQDVSFSCQPGRIFSLLGPNGAGKTTTLRMIATILQPSRGRITVAGHSVKEAPEKVRASIGFLTGSTGLYQRLTPSEVVKYFADLYEMDPQLFKQRKEELFELLGINEFAHKRIGQMSTGMKQKVSIARTMIHDPEVVVFDEPTSGLDVITAEHIISLIRSCKEQGKTVIFSSHIMTEVDLLCDDLAIIHQGQLKFSGTMDDFREQWTGHTLTDAFIQTVNQPIAVS